MNKFEKFSSLIEKIREHVPYYDQFNLNLNNNTFYEDFPCTSKKDIIDNYYNCIDKKISCNNEIVNMILSTNDLNRNHEKEIFVDGRKYKIETTSGTTGKALPIIKTDKILLLESKHLMKCRKRHNNKITSTNGFLLYHSVDPILRNIDLNYYSNQKDNYDKVLLYYLQNKNNIKWFFTTVLQSHRILNYLHNNPLLINECKSNNLFIWETTSQAMDENDKKELSYIFNTKFINNYGCREVWNIAYECECGCLHINEDYLLVDVVDDNGKIIHEDNTTGKIIITHLNNTETPFIKYYTGDNGRIIRNHCCNCGQKAPILMLESGRKFEKVKYTNFYGNDIFRRVLRGLYFHENNRDYDDVKIVQNDKTISVYVKGSVTDEFKKVFIELSEFLLRTQMFEYEFKSVSDLEFLKMESNDKAFLFKCL